jgi:hypothetical protein
MNFQYYFTQLQTPIFSFYQFDNQEVVTQYLDKVDDYLNIKKEHTSTKRKLFNVLVELIQQIRNIDKGVISLYEIQNAYVVGSKMQISAQYAASIQYTASVVERGNHNELKELYKKIIKNELPMIVAPINFLGFINMVRQGGKVYFQVKEIEIEEFNLEIIAVIHLTT